MERGVAEARADDGDQARHLGPPFGRLDERAEVERQPREAPAHHVRDPAAVVVAEADQRQAALPGPERDPVLLAHVDLARRAGEDGRVDREHADLSAVDAREAGHDRVSRGRLSRGGARGSASSPSSKKEPSSTSASRRSRAVRRPDARCRAIRSGPPIARAAARRRSSSASRSAIPRALRPVLPLVAHRPVEPRRAPLGERGDALGEVVAALQHRDRVDDVREPLPALGAEERLRGRERERRLLRDRVRPTPPPRRRARPRARPR